MLAKYLLVGQVTKPQGIAGLVRIRPETDDPARFLDLNTVYRLDGSRYMPLTIGGVSVRDGMVLARLAGASSRDEAEAQRGMALYVSREDAVALPEDRYFIADLVGCRLEDRQGKPLGELVEVLQPGSADVYVVRTASGRMLLPALKKVVLQVLTGEKRVIIDESVLPEVAVIED